MSKSVLLTLAVSFALLAAACGPVPTPTPLPLPTLPPLPSLVAPATPTIPPTAVPPTPTLLPATATPVQAASPTLAQSAPQPTRPPASPTSATAGLAPGLYVTELKIEPNPPRRNIDLTFSPTFVNAFNSNQNYRWIVYIFKTDTPSRSTGETPPAQTTIPTGTSDQKPGGVWKWGPGNQCDYFFARVGWLDQDRRIHMFTRPDGKVFEKGFTLCP